MVNGNPRLKAPGGPGVIVGLVATYVVICALASFLLGPLALALSLLLLLLEAAAAAECFDLRHQSVPWLLVAWTATVAAAAFVGGRNYHVSFAPYLTAESGRDYRDVAADAQASGHADGGIVRFRGDAVLDGTRSVGLRIFGRTYCAAPILSGNASVVDQTASQSQGPTVQFWAVGLDCCAARGAFDCDDASQVDARNGVVVHTPDEEGEEAMTRAVFAPRVFHEGYAAAIRASCALHQLQTAEPPVTLRWTSDPEAMLRGWLLYALFVWFLSSFMYCLAAAGAWACVPGLARGAGKGS